MIQIGWTANLISALIPEENIVFNIPPLLESKYEDSL